LADGSEERIAKPQASLADRLCDVTSTSRLNDFFNECAAFPNAAHDDQVDVMLQALLRWTQVSEQVVWCYEPYQISPI
jgi:predicted phage terminase large subunit-like protein